MGSPFDPQPESAWVWMCHDSGVPARFPAAAAEAWRALGWRDCDPPAEVDPTRAEMVPPPADTAVSTEPETTSDEGVNTDA